MIVGSGLGSRRKFIIYRRNLYKLFIWVVVKKKSWVGTVMIFMYLNSDSFIIVDLYLRYLREWQEMLYQVMSVILKKNWYY